MSSPEPVLQTSLPGFALLRRGKVRDVYEVDEEHLLFIATDRISAFDSVLGTPISRKGEVLTAISEFWFNYLSDLVPNHLITTKIDEMPVQVRSFENILRGRTMLVRRTQVFPIECVVRGYLAGSGWKDYLATGNICGHSLPPGLRESDRLPEPIFTPATKAEEGHDENISVERAAEIIGADATDALQKTSLALYNKAAEHARSCGIIIADTKFEFGRTADGSMMLIDEVLTPDSSRFWPAAYYSPGGPQPSFDKQFVRDYLESISWNKQPPAPSLPAEVAEATTSRYLEAFRLLTGRSLDERED
jgi:phosphoribosylaminoimidazole-succinocarboxamide synthase